MAEPTLDFMLAQTFALTGSVTGFATDQGGTSRAITYNATGTTTYHRTFLARTTGTAGSRTDPHEFLTHFRTALNTLGTYWDAGIGADGRVWIQYLGTGTGQLTLANIVANLLGHQSVIGPLASGAMVTGAHWPTHCVYSINYTGDTGWTRRRPKAVAQTLPNGQVYGFSDRQSGALRKFTMQFHPKNQLVRDAHNAANPGSTLQATNLYAPAARQLDSYTGEPGQAPPWSVQDTLNIALDQQVAVAWGNLQAIIANSGADLTFDVGYFTPEFLTSGGNFQPSAAMWDARWDALDIELSLSALGVTRV